MINRLNVAADRRGWFVLAFAAVALALALDLLVRHDPIGVDFHTYVAAGQTGLEQGWSHLYDQGLVAVEQKELAPGQVAQPFLSPPTVAFVTSPLASIPYDVAYVVWAVFLLAAFAVALAWAGMSKGWGRWIAVVGALAPWWVMHAVNVGQVVPLVAAGTVVAWRLTRDRREILAGVALAAILLKPNTAILVPFALLFAQRYRIFAAWAGVVIAVLLAVLLTVGVDGMSAYVTQLRGPLPKGADDLTLHGALSATGPLAAVLRVLIVGAVFAAAYRMRRSPGLVVPLAIIASLVISPYLHASDLCMLAAAGWMVWEERPALAWRVPLTLIWVLASPYLYLRGVSPHLKQWPWFEIALLLALVIAAWWPLTAWADSRRRAPA
ncbi:MAG: hypothetical protein AUH76_14450 [Candidatus Rokubacteria bacterium 13_1_40CM_4_67_11]|nr:MAG: hypothetical protein AUH76_14450 [Candidatus Rokubacteria bacterium 13_1_40CM_4_67_11]TME21191.1 MAG: DUF2029 domain-containing protein [Chloroflexota bacterium]